MYYFDAFGKLVVVILIFNSALLTLVRCDEDEQNVDGYPGENRCSEDCGNYGNCLSVDVFVPGCVPTLDDPKKCQVYKCVCSYGWNGPKCSIQSETCASSLTTSPEDNVRQCFNGGNCETYEITEPPEKQGEIGTRCNCQSLPTDTVAFAGHQCEFAAEQVCVRGSDHSTYAFCVNGGTCKEIIDENEEHPLCDCPSGFGGRHCQYVLAAKEGGLFELTPADEIKYVNIILHGKYGNETKVLEPSKSKDGLSGGMKFLILLLVVTFITIVCCIYIRGRRSSQSSSKATNTVSDTRDSAWDTTADDDDEQGDGTNTKNGII